VAPRNETRILESSDGSDDELEDDCPALIDIEIDDDDDDDNEDDNNNDADNSDGGSDKTEEPEESAEAELGQLLHTDVYTILTSPQIDFWRNGTHRFMFFSNLLRLSSTSRVDVSTFSSVLPPIVREKGMAE
jgi:hypothetical protein